MNESEEHKEEIEHPHHRYRRIALAEKSAEIDEELADVILELWRAEIRTVSSCQDAGEASADLPSDLPHTRERVDRDLGRAYIDFPSPDDASLFLEAMANAGPRDDFYERMVHWCSPGAWEKSISFDDWGLEEGDERAPDGSRLSRFDPSIIQVKFPRPDIPEILARLRRSNSGDVPPLGEPTWSTVSIEK